MKIIWESDGKITDFEFMPFHVEGCGDSGIIQTNELTRTGDKAIKFYITNPPMETGSKSVTIRKVIKQLNEPNPLPEVIFISQWRYIPSVPNDPLRWNCLSKYWAEYRNELEQLITLQCNIVELDGRGYFHFRLLTQNHTTGEVIKHHDDAVGEWHYDEWFRVTMEIKRHLTDGYVKWYVNDELVSEVYGVPTMVSETERVYPYFSNYVGFDNVNSPEMTHSIVTYMDDIVITDAPIPLDYRVVQVYQSGVALASLLLAAIILLILLVRGDKKG